LRPKKSFGVDQMPGTFLLQNGEIRRAFRHKLVSDIPDYLGLAQPATFPQPSE
jgi:hypothetical protein